MSTTSERPTKRRTLTQRDARLGLWLMSPTLLIVLALVVFPLLWADPPFVPTHAPDPGRHGGLLPAADPRQLQAGDRLRGAVDQPGDDVRLHRRLGHPRDRTRRVGVDRGPQEVPGPHLRPGGVPAALCGTGGGRHLHLADDAQSAVRHHQRVRPIGVRLGRADRVPLPGGRHLERVRPGDPGADGAAHRRSSSRAGATSRSSSCS